MKTDNHTSGKLTVGLSMLMLMAMALVASELRSGTEVDGSSTASPERILILEAGKG